MPFDFDAAFREWARSAPGTRPDHAATRIAAALPPRSGGRPRWQRLVPAGVAVSAALILAVALLPGLHERGGRPQPASPPAVVTAPARAPAPLVAQVPAPAAQARSASSRGRVAARAGQAVAMQTPAVSPASAVLVVPLDPKTTLYVLLD